MKLIRGLHNLQPHDHGCVLTIGNFDGVHRGHQQVLDVLQQYSQRLALPSVLMTFEPHPKEFFQPAQAPARLMTLSEKIQSLREFPLDKLLLIHFDENFSNLTADEFIEQLLLKKLGVKAIIVGEDFRFGRNREGDFDYLLTAAKRYNFTVSTVDTLQDQDIRVSSTEIRNALSSGNFPKAEKLLGKPFHMIGRVQFGDQRGRTIGFPTANIAVKRLHVPLRGVFAVDVEGLGESTIHGVANLGTRPTVDGLKTLLEVHLLDFKEMIYGKKINVIFKHKIRDEKKFASFSDLQQQIANDVVVAKQFHQVK